jgi:hypothetical protein
MRRSPAPTPRTACSRSRWALAASRCDFDRPLSPYLVGGIAFGINQWDGGPQPDGEGGRAGLGLRYRVGERILFAENAYHWGFGRSQLSFGVQF